MFCGVLVFFSLKTAIYNEFVVRKQSVSLVFILLMYFVSWFLVPQVLRFGAFLFSTLCFLYTGIIFLNSKYLRARIVFIIAFIISSFNIIPILIFLTQKSKLTQELISTIFISNIQEVKEYIVANFSFLHVLILIIFLIGTFFLFFFRKPDNSIKISRSLIFLFIISFLTSSLSGPTGALSAEFMSYLYQKRKLEKLVKARAEGLVATNFNIQTEPNQATKVVVIIGESLNRSYMGLYGYERNTTPSLSKLASDSTRDRLFVFNDVISPDVTTVPSLKKVLTNSTNQHPIPFEKSISVVDFFNKAGYKSYWISNQAPLGKFSTPISVISSAADSVYFTAFKKNVGDDGAPQGTFFDGELLEPFKSLISSNSDSKKQIYFVHLMGNHVNYEDRYPERFNFFKTKEPLSRNLYLNSILYNDWVVSNLMKISKENNVDVVFYFSDHGDELGYGHSSGNYKRGMSTIPFMVYLSQNYILKNPDLVKDLIKNKNTPGMTDNFFNVIQEVTGTKSSFFDPKESFISDNYIILKRKVIDNTISFDK